MVPYFIPNRLSLSSSSEPHATQAKPVVLVVEDHDDTRFLLKSVLEMHGCVVIEARAGDEAVTLAQLRVPDLILMDTTLPRLDGLSATRRIRQIKGLHYVPIIFVTGDSRPEFQEVAFAAGGNQCFLKPFNLGELELAVDAQLRREDPLTIS